MSGIARYAPRYLADQLLVRSIPIVTVSLLFLIPMMVAGPDDDVTRAQVTAMLSEVLSNIAPFFIIIATFGLMGEDIRQGYYRFLFAKPVSPVAYYAVAFLLTTVAFVVGVLATVGLWALVVRPVWPSAGLLEVMADFALLGTLIMLFSRFSRFDWLLALVFMGLSSVARARFPVDQSLLGKVFNIVLPPTDTGPLFPPAGVQWDPLTHVLLYAAVVFGLSLVLVRRIPMGSAR